MNLLDENIREDQRGLLRGGEFQFTNWVLSWAKGDERRRNHPLFAHTPRSDGIFIEEPSKIHWRFRLDNAHRFENRSASFLLFQPRRP